MGSLRPPWPTGGGSTWGGPSEAASPHNRQKPGCKHQNNWPYPGSRGIPQTKPGGIPPPKTQNQDIMAAPAPRSDARRTSAIIAYPMTARCVLHTALLTLLALTTGSCQSLQAAEMSRCANETPPPWGLNGWSLLIFSTAPFSRTCHAATLHFRIHLQSVAADSFYESMLTRAQFF